MGKVRRDGAALYRRCVAQKQGIERNFECFRCSLPRSDRLVCCGRIRPDPDCVSYEIQVEYSPLTAPIVRVLSPELVSSPKIHRYADGSLCLFFPPDDPWKSSDLIHKKIIPWIAEWLLYYEIFLSTGEWQGPEVPHDST